MTRRLNIPRVPMTIIHSEQEQLGIPAELLTVNEGDEQEPTTGLGVSTPSN